MNRTITPEDIARAAAAGAFEPALVWLRESPRTVADLVREHPTWASWAISYDLLDDQALLARIATSAADAYVRAVATWRLTDQA